VPGPRAATALRELARAAGLEVDYLSWRGAPACASDETVLAVLSALGGELGFSIQRPDDAPGALAALER
jgi:hypothetical protein